MALKNNYAYLLNKALEPYGISIDQKEILLKKNADIVNVCMRQVRNANDGILILDMIVSIDDHVESGWFVENILDTENKRIVRDEAITKFSIKDQQISNSDDLDVIE